MSTIRNRIGCILMVVLLLSGVPVAGASSGGGIAIMGVYQPGDACELNLSIRVTDSAGAPAYNLQTFAFNGNGAAAALSDKQLAEEDVGHILVVDTSLYYSSTALDMTVITGLVSAITQSLPPRNKVMLITTDSRGITEHGWGAPEAVTSKLAELGQSDSTECDLYGAVLRAVQMASGEGKSDAPAFISSVFVVTDCMITAGADRAQSSILSALNDKKNLNFLITWPDRASFFTSGSKNTSTVLAGKSELENFAANMGGKLIGISHKSGAGLGSTAAVSREVLNLTRSVYYFKLDLSSLVGKVLYRQDDTVTLDVTTGNFSLKIANIPFNSLLVPAPTPTPTPTPTPEPTPTSTPSPTPTPAAVVSIGQTDSNARKALYRLAELYYLNVDTNGEFNAEAQKAYDLFCQYNGLRMTDGIFAEGWEKLTRGQPIPNPTPTPSPTPTPTPRPLYDLYINQTDEENGDKRIQELQRALVRLNCYGYYGLSYKTGVFDDATLKAVQLFSEKFGMQNSVPTGVSKELQDEILNGKFEAIAPSPTPSPSPEPTPKPWADLKVGDTDSANGDTRIQDLQTKLKSLNYFDFYNLTLNPGVFDGATKEAVDNFSRMNGLVNAQPAGISGPLLKDILDEEKTWPPIMPTPTPAPTTIVEGIKDELDDTLTIGNFTVQLWIVVAAGVVLLLIIIIVLILLKAGKNKEVKFTNGTSGHSKGGIKPPAGKDLIPDQDKTRPQDGISANNGSDSEATEYVGACLSVTIQIEYAGQTQMQMPDIGSSYIIGRKEGNLLLDDRDKGVSRKHAELFYKNGALMIRDLYSVNGTYVDGTLIPGKNDDSRGYQGDMTMPMNMSDAAQDGYPLKNGSKVRLGHHTLTISW